MWETINNNYIVQLQIDNGTEQVGMDPAKICQQCLALKKKLAECHILAKVVECELEAKINENTQLQTQVGEIQQGVDPQGPSAGTGKPSTQMLNEKGVSMGHWPVIYITE